MRNQLISFSSLEDVLFAFQSAKNIIFITGAGVSVSCGIPDFRSKRGIYNTMECSEIGIPSAELLFDLNYFQMDPDPFYKYAHNLMPPETDPSLSHIFISQLEAKGKLLRNYTQNIDGLERKAGVTRVVECHGTMERFRCMKCRKKVGRDSVADDIIAQRVPMCPHCKRGVLKPMITFFGESLEASALRFMASDAKRCDLVVVMGTSLKVGGAVWSILQKMPEHVPQVLINLDDISPPKDISDGFDVRLLGKCDDVVDFMLKVLQWGEYVEKTNIGTRISECEVEKRSEEEEAGEKSKGDLEGVSTHPKKKRKKQIKLEKNATTQEPDTKAIATPIPQKMRSQSAPVMFASSGVTFASTGNIEAMETVKMEASQQLSSTSYPFPQHIPVVSSRVLRKRILPTPPVFHRNQEDDLPIASPRSYLPLVCCMRSPRVYVISRAPVPVASPVLSVGNVPVKRRRGRPPKKTPTSTSALINQDLISQGGSGLLVGHSGGVDIQEEGAISIERMIDVLAMMRTAERNKGQTKKKSVSKSNRRGSGSGVETGVITTVPSVNIVDGETGDHVVSSSNDTGKKKRSGGNASGRKNQTLKWMHPSLRRGVAREPSSVDEKRSGAADGEDGYDDDRQQETSGVVGAKTQCSTVVGINRSRRVRKNKLESQEDYQYY